MKIINITNICCFHDIDIYDRLKNQYGYEVIYFITEDLPEERIAMKYEQIQRDYVINSKTLSDEQLDKYFEKDDIVILGSCLDQRLYQFAKKVKNIIFSCEHIVKHKTPKNYLSIIRFFMRTYKRYGKNNLYLLGSSSRVGKEFKFFGFKENQLLKFGYFPLLETVNDEEIMNRDPFSLLWIGRMVEFKHPEKALDFLKALREKDDRYHLTYVGDGELKGKVTKLVEKRNLSNCVEFLPFYEHTKLMEIYKSHSIFLFPSDIGEGWGVVLNEALSQGCIVFANEKAGSTKFLVKSGENGYSYKNGKQLKDCISSFASLSNERILKMRLNARDTIKTKWNSEVAAQRCSIVFKNIFDNKEITDFDDGPLSKY